MKKAFRKWFGGVEVSEVSIVLPFVQIALKPSSKSETTAVAHAVHEGNIATDIPVVDLTVNAKKLESIAMVNQGLIKTELAYKIALAMSGENYVSKWSKWQRLTGNIELFCGDVVWLVWCFQNASDKVLHNIQMDMLHLPFVSGLPGVFVLGSTGSQIGSASSSVQSYHSDVHKHKT